LNDGCAYCRDAMSSMSKGCEHSVERVAMGCVPDQASGIVVEQHGIDSFDSATSRSGFRAVEPKSESACVHGERTTIPRRCQ
jgi:hypothetical protein